MKLLGQYTALVHGWGTSARCAFRPVCVTALGASERYLRYFSKGPRHVASNIGCSEKSEAAYAC